jgi:hypothetical protein
VASQFPLLDAPHCEFREKSLQATTSSPNGGLSALEAAL